MALAGLLQYAQCVVGPLPFAVELNPPGQPIILYLAGREAGQRERRRGPEIGSKARQGRPGRDEAATGKGEETGKRNRRDRVRKRTRGQYICKRSKAEEQDPKST